MTAEEIQLAQQNMIQEIEKDLEHWSYAISPDGDFRASLTNWLRWHKSSYGWHPLQRLEVPCFSCKNMIPIRQVYRCYECDTAHHKKCLINHCEESRRYTKYAEEAEKKGSPMPEHLIPQVPHYE